MESGPPWPADRQDDRETSPIPAFGPNLAPDLAMAGSIDRLCRISSIGVTGAILHADFAIDEGERLELDLESGERLSGVVAWRRGTALGLTFDGALDLLGFITCRIATTGDDRRKMPRIEVGRPGRACFAGRWGEVTICEISPGGARIDSAFNLCRGDKLVVSAEGLGKLDGRVRWVKASRAGIRFDSELAWPDLLNWIAAGSAPESGRDLLPACGGGEVHPGNLPVNLMARVREGPRRWEIEIVALSTRNVRFDCYAPLGPGALLWLTLPGLEGWPARVSQVEGFRLECEFLQPLHPAVVERILARAEAADD